MRRKQNGKPCGAEFTFPSVLVPRVMIRQPFLRERGSCGEKKVYKYVGSLTGGFCRVTGACVHNSRCRGARELRFGFRFYWHSKRARAAIKINLTVYKAFFNKPIIVPNL